MTRLKKNDTYGKMVYIETYGCQMNQYDSNLMAGILSRAGYTVTNDRGSAGVWIVNTCSVREHAEQRALANIRQMGQAKRNGTKLVVTGCMAQRMGADLADSNSRVDLIVGTDQYSALPALLEQADEDALVEIDSDPDMPYPKVFPFHTQEVSCFVAIMRGCNNYCSYCIVPYVRGRERSRPAKDIQAEVREAAAKGCKEIVLLGQNVNSYHDGNTTFPDLLRALDAIEEGFRIRFLTSHPKDLSDALIRSMQECGKVCEHLHLPVQAGADRILALMNRGYTRAQYMERANALRRAIPDVSLTTDVMVGFPGETEAEFCQTLDLMRTIGFDEAFTYRYSTRPGTQAAGLDDDVPEQEKKRRLADLISVQRDMTRERYRALVGNTFEVLLERPSAKNPSQWWGRTRTGRPVVVTGDGPAAGIMVSVKVTASTGATLTGKIEGE